MALRSVVGPNVLVSHMEALAPLSAEEVRFLQDQTVSVRQHAAHTELHAERDSANQSILMSGWACQQRLLADGRRQIVSFVLPGDIIGPLQPSGPPATCATVALTPVETADAARVLRRVTDEGQNYTALAQAVRLLAVLQDVFLRDQIVRLGLQTAQERMTHLMLELHFRLRMASLADDKGFAMPLKQDVLADSLGVSLVHVNRTLQQIRRDGLLDIRGGRVSILRMGMMETIADWTPPLGINLKPASARVLRDA